DMLLVGVVISSIYGVIDTYYRLTMSPEMLTVLTELGDGRYINTDPISFRFMFAAFFIGFIPLFLMRYSLNANCFSDDDAYSMGVRPGLLRYSSVIFATFLLVAALVHVGGIGMISLIVPHFCRYFMGLDFRRLLWGCFFYGGIVLLVCRAVGDSISIFSYATLPVGIVVSVVAAPVFVIILLQQRRGWE
ncbi:MAG: iron ABC transporter permease, partial [Clostridiales bacterium]|nr:iron ABC transporter permease [Clostridiales bacterium]